MEETKKHVRAVIIGCGAIHTMHADALATMPDAKIVGFADIDLSRAQAAAEKYGGRAYGDYQEMLAKEQPDVVHICTPHYLHEPMAVYAMEHGCDVFCEKPMAITVEGALHMQKVAEESKRCLGICFQNRFRLCTQTAMQKLKGGDLGHILGAKAEMTWNRDMDYYRSGPWRGLWKTEGGGVLINQSIHTLDLLDQFCGGFSSVHAHVARYMLQYPYEVEDTAIANFMLPSGGNALFFVTNCYVSSTPPTISVVCEHGTLTLDNELLIEYADGHRENYSDPTGGTSGKPDWGHCHRKAIACFYNCRKTGVPFPIGPEQGIRTIRLIDAIYHSSMDNRDFRISELS